MFSVTVHGKSAFAASIHGLASSIFLSSITEKTAKLFFDNSVYISCQTGKSCLHPHQEACTTRQSFLPKCSDKRCRLPSRSGNSKSGA